MTPWAKFARAACIGLVAAGCGATSPPPKQTAVSCPFRNRSAPSRIQNGDDLLNLPVPPPVMDFGMARCLLWHPDLDPDDAFFAVVPMPSGEEIAIHLRIDRGSVPYLVEFFVHYGRRVRNPILGRDGWIAACKPDDGDVLVRSAFRR